MATASKLWTWDAGLESWTTGQDGDANAQRDASNGDPSAGSCQMYLTAGRTQSGYGWFYAPNDTWANVFGVSSTAFITDVQVLAGTRTRAGLTHWVPSATPNWSMAVQIYDNETWNDLWIRSGTTQDSSWNTGSAGTKRTLTNQVPTSFNMTNSSFGQLLIELFASTGNTANSTISCHLDYLTVEITYVEASSPWTFYANDGSCGRAEYSDPTYSTAQTATSAELVVTSAPVAETGGFYETTPSSMYYIDETFLAFDTSVIPDTATITSATLKLWCTSVTRNSEVHVQEVWLSNWTPTLTVSDWQQPSSLGTSGTKLATLSTSGLTTGADKTFTSESAFVSNINKTGYTGILIVDDQSRLGNAPTTSGENQVQWALAANGANYRPKLVVEWTTSTPYTGTATGAADLQKSLTGTATGSADLQKSLTGTATGSAALVKSYTGTATGSADLLKALSGNADGSADLKKSLSGSATGAADLLKALTGSATGAAALLQAQSSTAQGSAALLKALSGAAEGSAYVQAGATPRTGDATGSAALLKAYSGNATGAADLLAQRTANATGAADLQKSLTSSATGSAYLAQMRSGTATGSADLTKSLTGSAEGAAYLAQMRSGSATGAAALVKAYTGTATGSADLKASRTGTAEGSAALLAQRTGSALGAADLTQARTGTATGSAFLFYQRTGTATGSADLLKAYSGQAEGAAALLQARSSTAAGSADLLQARTGTAEGSADLQKALTGTAEGSALLFYQRSGTATGAAYLAGAPLISDVVPSEGPKEGGTEVTITGKGFLLVTELYFGTTRCWNFTVDSDTQMTATSPPGTGF